MRKKIIVTGAASGIGKSIALACAKSGASVLAVDINEKGLKKIKGKNITTFTCDVADPEQIAKFFSLIKKLRLTPYGLVNNAGIYLGKNFFEYSDAEIQKVLNVNINSAIHFSRKFAEILIPKKTTGVIINITSVSGEKGSPDVIYGLSKAALTGLTKSCAISFAPFIRVNAIAPGIVNTPLLKNMPAARLRHHRAIELLRDIIEPEDIAATTVFLLSNSAKKYTGATFDINNGSYLR
jgi:3-oxoacyl-[acyl-carrier protein] reductase